MTLTGNRWRRADANSGFPLPVGDYQAAGLDLDGFLLYARPVVHGQDDAGVGLDCVPPEPDQPEAEPVRFSSEPSHQ
jgi:hypothetical protein